MVRRRRGGLRASRRYAWAFLGGLALLGWLASALSPSKDHAKETSATTRDAAPRELTIDQASASEALETGSDVLSISTNGTEVALTDGRQLITIDSNGKPIPVLSAQQGEPFHEVALGTRSLYWSQGGCSRWSLTTRIGRRDTNGTRIVVDSASPCVETMAVDGDAPYWIEQAGGVVLRTLDKSEKPKVLWSDATIIWASDLAVRGQKAFFIAQGKDEDRILRIDLSTGAVTTIAVESKQARHLVVRADGTCFWTACPYNASCTLKTSADRPAIELAHTAGSLALNAGYVWWFDTDADPDVLLRVPVVGGKPERVAKSPHDKSILLRFAGGDAVWSTENHLWRLSTSQLAGKQPEP